MACEIEMTLNTYVTILLENYWSLRHLDGLSSISHGSSTKKECGKHISDQ